jgi:heat shock protein HslJ
LITVGNDDTLIHLYAMAKVTGKKEAGNMKPFVGLLIFGLLLSVACSHTGTPSMGVNELVGTEWVLEDLGGTGVADRVQSSVRFEKDDKIVGWGGCNRYFAGFRSDGNSIDIGPIGSTRRICPSVVMDQEERFFKALEKARRVAKQDTFLVIDVEGLEKPLRFSRLQSSEN